MSVLALKQVSVNYGKEPALCDVSIDCAAGQTIALAGANGSGKSTLLRAVAGAIRLESGKICINGRSLGHRRNRAQRGAVCWINQDFALDPELTLQDTCRFWARLLGIAPETAQPLLSGFALEGMRSKLVSELSGGMRQKLHLVLGLMQPCDVLLADEPTNALDPQSSAFFWQYISDFSGVSIVSSHDWNELDRHASHLAVLERGRLKAFDAVSKLLAAQDTPTIQQYCQATIGDAGNGKPRIRRGRNR